MCARITRCCAAVFARQHDLKLIPRLDAFDDRDHENGFASSISPPCEPDPASCRRRPLRKLVIRTKSSPCSCAAPGVDSSEPFSSVSWPVAQPADARCLRGHVSLGLHRPAVNGTSVRRAKRSSIRKSSDHRERSRPMYFAWGCFSIFCRPSAQRAARPLVAGSACCNDTAARSASHTRFGVAGMSMWRTPL